MVAKRKKVAQKAPKLVKMLCEGCGRTIEVLRDSECSHCGQQMVKDAKWRHRK
mgnify:CR=1 FL=1